ncbi:aspartyl-phosphate phosphatase Spo0E family protein [Desulfosporosinus sp. SB140]|uniref:aspartyl-phosphate phosphatase Spo0E family protein n=1 Tax=Desulfosporosinus paludis TaxID=3115649 RepID=UPI00389042A0
MRSTTIDRIEKLRLQMQETATGKDLTDPRVVKASEKLDLLILDFYHSLEKQKKYYKLYR